MKNFKNKLDKNIRKQIIEMEAQSAEFSILSTQCIFLKIFFTNKIQKLKNTLIMNMTRRSFLKILAQTKEAKSMNLLLTFEIYDKNIFL